VKLSTDQAEFAAPIIVASHRRSGTHLTIDLIRRNFPETSIFKLPLEHLDNTYLNLDRLDPAHERSIAESSAIRTLTRAARPLVKTHAHPDFSNIRCVAPSLLSMILDNAKIIYVHRDIRDVMRSLYLYRLDYYSAKGVSPTDFLHGNHCEGNPIEIWVDHVCSWLESSPDMVLSFDDIIRFPRRIVDQISDRLSLKSELAEPLLPLPIKNRFEARLLRILPGRPRATTVFGSASPNSSEAKQRLFNEEDNNYIISKAEGMMKELGYL